MNDRELNETLKRAVVPGRKPEYWEQFPARVTAEINRREQRAGVPDCDRSADLQSALRGPTSAAPAPAIERAKPTASRRSGEAWSWAAALRSLAGKPAFAIGVAALCLGVVLLAGSWKSHPAPPNEPQLAEVRKYFHEIAALFPNQLQAIVFDQQGTHLVLAGEPNLPASPPLYLKICGPQGCQSFVTFSGQQIRVNGDLCDVLADGRGGVLIVGRQLVWSGSGTPRSSGQYQIEARALEGNS